LDTAQATLDYSEGRGKETSYFLMIQAKKMEDLKNFIIKYGPAQFVLRKAMKLNRVESRGRARAGVGSCQTSYQGAGKNTIFSTRALD